MRVYIIRRILLMIPALFLTTIVIFFIIRLIPGDVVDAMIAEVAEVTGSGAGVSRTFIEQELGLDMPHRELKLEMPHKKEGNINE